MDTKKSLAFFEDYQIRRVFDEKKQEWLFSVVDVVRALTQHPTHRGAANYWKVLRGRLKREGSQLVTNCYQLKLMSSDGKEYLTDVANAETLLRLDQSRDHFVDITDMIPVGKGAQKPVKTTDRFGQVF